MYMSSTTILLPFLFVISVKAKDAANNLLLFQNVDGSEFKVNSSRIEVINGSKFSLICKIVKRSNEESVLDSHLSWSKRKGKIKFSNAADKNEDANILNFTSVTLNDQGKYFCRNMKDGQFRRVQLIVKNGTNNGILKDSRHHHYKRDTDFSKIREENDKALKLWKEELDKKYNSETYNYNNNYNSHSKPVDSDDDYKKAINKLSENRTDTPLKIFYMMIAAVAMFVIIYAITKCCHDNAGQQTNRSNSSPQRQARDRQYQANRRNNLIVTNSGRCSHRACIDYRLQDPSLTCLLDIANTNSQPTYGFDSPLPRMYNGSNSLDLPPTYQDSTANSAASSTTNLHIPDDGFSTRILNADNTDNSPLPPTYEDALVNIVLSEPQSSDTHTTGHDSGGAGDSGGTTDYGGSGGDSGGGGGDSGGGGGSDD